MAFAVLGMLLMTWVPGVMILTCLSMAHGNCREEGKGGRFLHESRLWTRHCARHFPTMKMVPEASIDLPSQSQFLEINGTRQFLYLKFALGHRTWVLESGIVVSTVTLVEPIT